MSAVLYQWDVLAPLARPLFAWNHGYVMRSGADGLARLLGARLVTAGGAVVRRQI